MGKQVNGNFGQEEPGVLLLGRNVCEVNPVFRETEVDHQRGAPHMSQRLQRVLKLWIAVVLLLALSARGETLRLVLNPYEGVDWTAWQQLKANFHAHTTESDGSASPDRMIDEYLRHGYSVLAITDHNRCTWPWKKWGRNARDLGMIAIAGNELSRHHHTLSLFIEFETSSENLEQSLKEVANAGGVAILAHPGRYWKPQDDGRLPKTVLERYRMLFAEHPVLLGMEVINADNRYPHDVLLWDGLLGSSMPARPIWGFANDDAHSRSAVGLNWSAIWVPEPKEHSVREALQLGRFFFASVTTRERRLRDPAQVPTVEAVLHDPDRGIITIRARCGSESLPEEACRWVANGEVVHVGRSFPYGSAKEVISYVRAELQGPGGTTFTQPFGFVVEKP
jgi:hypothetical protein